jgi:type IV pilus assembly protein PilN
MIRINLLPVRAAKKKETLRQQQAVFLLSVLAVAAVGLALYFFLQLKIGSTKDEITKSEAEIQALKAKIGKINELKKLKDEVKKKLNVLDMLRKGKVGPVHRLMTLSDSTPDKLWLTRYAENGSSVSIAGVAYNEDLIASFMRNLEASPDYQNVELVVSEQTEMSGTKVKKFELKMNLEPPKSNP